jgi:hypothetical protein
MNRKRWTLSEWLALSDSDKDHEFVVDEYLQRQLSDIMQNSMYDPKADHDENAKTMDGTTRGLILLIESGLLS